MKGGRKSKGKIKRKMEVEPQGKERVPKGKMKRKKEVECEEEERVKGR